MDTAEYKQTVTAAFDRAAAHYDRLGVEFFTPMGLRLVDHADPRPGQRVLDVGCGRGACLFPAARRVAPDGYALGIDIAPAMVEEAAAEAERLGMPHVEVRVMDGERPALPERSFERVLGSYSVIFFPEALPALVRYAGLLADGGASRSPARCSPRTPFLPAPVFTELIPRSLLDTLPPDWRPEALRRRFNSWLERPDDLEATMRRAGFGEVGITDETVPMVAVSGEAWVDWSHTNGMRLLWQHLPRDEAQRLRERLITELDAMRRADAPLSIPVPVRFVTAVVDR
ncbi:class I SAM-dependent methyltransferase [Streptomyces nogalater]